MTVNSLTLFSVIGVLALGIHSPAAAQSTAADASVQSLGAIQRAAVAGLRRGLDPGLTGVELNATGLDERLRLPACPAPLVADATPPRAGQSRALVRVACDANHWNINVSVDIRRTAPVLVMRRAVARGEPIGAADVVEQTRVLPGLASPFVGRVSELSGRVTRRTVLSGTALTADALTPALLIHRGQSVTLTSSAAGLEVNAPGRAMADAGQNQRVRVQNLYSLKIVEGVADTEGVVRVGP